MSPVLKYWSGTEWISVGAGNAWQAGDMKMTMRSTAPEGWLLCDGSLKSQASYPDLFTAIGHSGNGGVDPGGGNFKLPDLRKRVPLGKAASGTGSTLGATGGSNDAIVASHGHTQNSHTHTQDSHGHSGAAGTNGNHQHDGPNQFVVTHNADPFRLVTTGSSQQVTFTDLTDAAGSHGHDITVGAQTATNQSAQPAISSAGVSASEANMPEFQVVNYLIKT